MSEPEQTSFSKEFYEEIFEGSNTQALVYILNNVSKSCKNFTDRFEQQFEIIKSSKEFYRKIPYMTNNLSKEFITDSVSDISDTSLVSSWINN